ncbi:hypothetical protein PUN28_012674 [Cardiocondyla obscurior]|uniref:Uncharacterized protein n=1 Tax=Cardiocondyla obscurior TaxID=286306 RepID=A0AAW2FGH6_9HYME
MIDDYQVESKIKGNSGKNGHWAQRSIPRVALRGPALPQVSEKRESEAAPNLVMPASFQGEKERTGSLVLREESFFSREKTSNFKVCAYQGAYLFFSPFFFFFLCILPVLEKFERLKSKRWLCNYFCIIFLLNFFFNDTY